MMAYEVADEELLGDADELLDAGGVVTDMLQE